MKPEKFMLGFIEKSFADQTKIGYIFLIPPAPNLAPFIPADDGETGMTDMFLFLDAIPESGIARPEYTSQNTVTGRIRAFPAATITQSNSMALHAGFFRQCDGLRPIPINIHEYSSRSVKTPTDF